MRIHVKALLAVAAAVITAFIAMALINPLSSSQRCGTTLSINGWEGLSVYVCGSMGCPECREYVNWLVGEGVKVKFLGVCSSECVKLMRELITEGVTPSIPITVLQGNSSGINAVVVGPLRNVKLLAALSRLVSSGEYALTIKQLPGGEVMALTIKRLSRNSIPVYELRGNSLILIKVLRHG